MISTLTKKHSFDTVFDSQKVFRLILEASANPARVVSVKEYAGKLNGRHPVLLAAAMTLLDNEVSFNTCGDRQLASEIASLTLAKEAGIENADFIFAGEAGGIGGVIEKAKCGTLADPHKSATVIILDDGGNVIQLELAGPGINGRVNILTTPAVQDALKQRDAQHYEYPQGIDLIFVSSAGDLTAIPRTTRVAGRP